MRERAIPTCARDCEVWRMRRLLSSIAVTASLLMTPLAPASAEWVEVSTDGDSFNVRGGLIHDDDYEGDRGEAATCVNCYWRINAVCKSFLVGSQGACPGLLARCPVGMRPVEVLRANATSRPSDSSPLWHRTGYSCVGDRGPASTGSIRSELTGGWQAKVPALSVSLSPPLRTLVRLPVAVTFKSAGSLQVRRLVVDGVEVTLRAVATRRVLCGVSWCAKSGARTAVFHQTGVTSLTVQATWSGTFDALGLTGVPVADDPVRQSEVVPVRVKALRRKLV